MKNKKKKSIDDMSVEELLEELRKSQGPRGCTNRNFFF